MSQNLIEEMEVIGDHQKAEGEPLQDVLIDRSLYQNIKKQHLEVRPSEGFRNTFLDKFKRRKQVYYGEKHSEVRYTGNRIALPLLIKSDIEEKLQNIGINTEKTVVHLGAARIMIKAAFREGLNTPLNLVLRDDRIIPRKAATYGIIEANLCYQKLIFTLYPQHAVSLTGDLDKILVLLQDFKRKDLMKDGSHSYTITYHVSYAVSNSHGVLYEDKEFIEIPDVFKSVGRVHPPEYADEIEMPEEV